MDFDDLINKRCCACDGIIGEHGNHINGVMLDRRAQWEYPVAGNIITGEEGKAIAFICDECIGKCGKRGKRGKRVRIKYAVRFEESKVFYIPVGKLVKVP